MAVDITGLYELLDDFEDVKSELDELKSDIVKRLGADALALTVDASPVKTGRLRRSWDVSPVYDINATTKAVQLFNAVPYAEYVEYGHRTRNHKGWVEGKFMATKSCEIVQKHAEQTAKEVVIKKIKEVLNG
jgi:hypothetical protein